MAIGAYKNAVYGVSQNTNGEKSDSEEERNATSK